MNTRKTFLIGMLMVTMSSGVIADGGGACRYESNKMAGHHRSESSPGHKLLGKMGDRLNLSESQRAQIKSILDVNHEAVENQRKQRHELRLATMELDPASTSYQTEMSGLARKKAELVHSSTMLRGDIRQQIASVLTAEQQFELRKLREKRLEKMRQRMKNRNSSDSVS